MPKVNRNKNWNVRNLDIDSVLKCAVDCHSVSSLMMSWGVVCGLYGCSPDCWLMIYCTCTADVHIKSQTLILVQLLMLSFCRVHQSLCRPMTELWQEKLSARQNSGEKSITVLDEVIKWMKGLRFQRELLDHHPRRQSDTLGSSQVCPTL